MTKPKKYPIGLSAEDLQKNNADNASLASRAFTLFWEDEDCEDDFVSGGSTKHLWISGGEPPVRLGNASSPLAMILQLLYKLLQRHYMAVNHADLEKFKCKVLGSGDGSDAVPVPPADTTGQNTSTPTAVQEDPPWLADIKRVRDRIRMQSSRTTAAVASSSTSAAPAPSSREPILLLERKSERVLDNHTAILHAFDSVLYEKGTAKNLAALNDKWFDQFDGLGAYIGADDGESLETSKRKRENSEVDRALFETLKKKFRGDFG